MPKLHLKLCTLTGPFKVIHETAQECESSAAALAIVQAHALAGGFTNVQEVQEDVVSVRYTAKTPGGRSGRNIAFADYCDDISCPDCGAATTETGACSIPCGK